MWANNINAFANQIKLWNHHSLSHFREVSDNIINYIRVGLQNKRLFLGPTLIGSNPMLWHPNARSTLLTLIYIILSL